MQKIYNTLIVLSIFFLYYLTFSKTDNNKVSKVKPNIINNVINQIPEKPKIEIYKENILKRKNISLLNEKSVDHIRKEEV